MKRPTDRGLRQAGDAMRSDHRCRVPGAECRVPGLVALIIVAILMPAHLVAAQAAPGPLVPQHFTLAEPAQAAIDAPWLTDEERHELRIFHGVWDERDLVTPLDRARAALAEWRFDDPALGDPALPAALRAEAAFLQGQLEEALELIEGDQTLHAARLRAEALELLGRHDQALRAASEPVQRLGDEAIESAAELTEGVRALIVRSRLQEQPSRDDFQAMLDLLARAHQVLDRLYWPARLAEAKLLLDKDHEDDGIAALHEALHLNPRSAEAWYELGRVALRRFDFGSAELAATALRRQNPRHPLADLLLAESRLIQDDVEGATALLDPLVERLPRLRSARDYVAAAAALSYDRRRLDDALAECDRLSPGSARAYAVVGRHLSLNRQYELAAEILEEAIRRQPAWPQPQIELGLLELQSGRDTHALHILRDVVELDPFNKRAANSLVLLEELTAWTELTTEHFVIRYRPGIDQVMVEMMPERLEQIHRTVSQRFQFEPEQRTVLEVMPDHSHFSVRITGMPRIHTVAACTGPVIAMEVPREGRSGEHNGLYDWPRVIQHEYTHTITLAQTRNRIPHWLTEAAAVSMEMTPRSYERCMMLAQSWDQGTLFNLDEIKWAFVRPKRPEDRSRAYAQGHWMVQFMDERFGSSALVRLMERYFEGQREQEAMPAALGVSREEFFRLFRSWAGAQVQAWGLAARPTIEELADEVRLADEQMALAMDASQQARLDAIARALAEQVGRPAPSDGRSLRGEDWPELVRPPVRLTDERLTEWLAAHPDHPDLLELAARRHIQRAGIDDEAIELLRRYAEARPVDPYPHKKLAEHWLASEAPHRAIEHLEPLDELEEKSPVYAIKLAKLYRTAGEQAKALEKATRALHIDPYRAANRELAAAIAIEAGELEAARQHIVALTLLEPDRPQHQRRLAALERMMK